MAILCGTDFSAQSAQALTVACALAARGGAPLHVVHALEPGSDTAAGSRSAQAREQLAEQARLQGVTVEVQSKRGTLEAVVLDAATTLSPELIVIGAGRELGIANETSDHADRILSNARQPVLVVRDAKPFADWVAGVRPLKILFGADFSRTSEAAARFLPALRRFGPVDVLAHHVYYPPQELQFVGVSGVRRLDARAELSGTLNRDLAAHFAQIPELGPIAVGVEPHLGSVGARLAGAANEIGVDLLVIGSRDWGPQTRHWEGSVTRTALRSARVSALCVHASSPITRSSAPRPKNVLVATDFSPAANAAVTFAYSLLQRGGAMHLLHVVRDATSPEHADAVSVGRRLRELVPADAGELHMHTHTHVIVSNHPAEAICEAAEQLGADTLCLGMSAGSAHPERPIGAVAAAVLAATKRPVLLVKEEPH